MRLETIHQIEFGLRFLVPALGELLLFHAALLDTVEIGEDQFRVDYLDIANGIDRVHHVFDIGIFKTANHLDDRIHFADVAEKLVAESGAFAGSADEAGDIDEFEDRGDQLLEPLIFDSTSRRSSGTVTMP